MIYSPKDLGVICYVAGLLTGMVVAFASCAPDPDAAHGHITTGARQ